MCWGFLSRGPLFTRSLLGPTQREHHTDWGLNGQSINVPQQRDSVFCDSLSSHVSSFVRVMMPRRSLFYEMPESGRKCRGEQPGKKGEKATDGLGGRRSLRMHTMGDTEALCML